MSSDLPSDEAFAFLPGHDDCGLLVLADHATNIIPPPYGDLGLPPGQIDRHIGYDIGTEWLVRHLNRIAHVPVLMTRFSRLVIDPNRGEDDPTLVMRLSDGAIVPGNAQVDAAERARRIARFHRPYHQAIAAQMQRMAAAGPVPVLLSMHSFTPAWKGVARPWELAVLWDRDDRLAAPLIASFRAMGWTVGDNEPYDGALKGDTLHQHGTVRGIAHVLVEVRQDLIATPADAAIWAERVWGAVAPLAQMPEMHEICFFGSRTDPA